MPNADKTQENCSVLLPPLVGEGGGWLATDTPSKASPLPPEAQGAKESPQLNSSYDLRKFNLLKIRAFPQATCRGFTLLEVLVALAIVAIALTAGLQAAGALTRHAQRQSDMLLAQLCAENALVGVRLARQLPGVGDNRTECVQGGRSLNLLLAVRPTPNPNFRRVDAQVLDAETPIWRLTTVVGRY